MTQPVAAPVVRGSSRSTWLGWVLCVPAVAVGVWQLVIPAAQTVVGSLYRTRLAGRGERQFIGLEAYEDLELFAPLLLGTVIGLPAFALAGGVGLLIGQLAARASGALRLVTRVLLGLLLVGYAPVGIATAMRSTATGPIGLATLVFALVVTALPIVVGVAGAVSMATARSAPALLIAAAVGLATTIATGWQLLGLPLALTGGGPRRTTQTPGLLVHELAFQRLSVDRAMAVSTVLLALLAVLGIVVALLLLALAVRVDWWPKAHAAAGPGEPGRGVAAIVVAALVVVAFLVLAHPWVAQLLHLDAGGLTLAQGVRILVNTWLPPLVAVIVQLLVGGLAAFGLAVLRPWGDRSIWLLLGFAPGLFVGLVPLAAAHLLGVIEAGRLGAPSLVPPAMLSVPILYVLTFVFAGLRRSWLADSRNKGPALLAGVGIVVLCGIVSYVLLAQSLIWNLLVARGLDDSSGPAVLLRLVSRAGGLEEGLPQQLATPVPLLILLGALAAAALVAMDRLTVHAGPPAPRPVPHPPPVVR